MDWEDRLLLLAHITAISLSGGLCAWAGYHNYVFRMIFGALMTCGLVIQVIAEFV